MARFIFLAFLVLPVLSCGQETYSIKDTTQAFKWGKIAQNFFSKESYDSAKIYFNKANVIIEKIPNYQKDTVLLKTYFYHYNHLARTYMYLGLHSKAKIILDNLLKEEKEFLGTNNTTVPITLTFLGTYFRETKEYLKAIKQHREAIRIRKMIFGKDVLAISYNYNYMANCFMDIEQADSALTYLDKALSIKKKNLPADHLEIALVEHSIGGVYHRVLRDFNQAEEHYQIAFNIRNEQIPESDYMAQSYNVLGMLYRDRGEVDKAKVNFQKALKIRKSIFGLEHTQTFDSFGLLAEIARMQGENDKAIKYHLKILDIISNSQKLDQELYYYYLPNLATEYYMKGDYLMTAKYDKILLDRKIQELRKDDISPSQYAQIGLAYQNLATNYAQMEDFESAEKYMIQALRYTQKSNLKSRELRVVSDLGVLYHRQGNLDLAEKYLLEFKNAYFNDFDTDSTLYAARLALNLGSVYAQRAEFDRAYSYLQKAYEIREKILGKDHVETYKILGTIGNSFIQEGKFSKAKKIIDKALIDADFSPDSISIIQYELLLSYAQVSRKIDDFNLSLEYANYALQSIGFTNGDIDIYPYKRMALSALSQKAISLYRKYQSNKQLKHLIEADSIYTISLNLLMEMRDDKEYKNLRKINNIYNTIFENSISIKKELLNVTSLQNEAILFSLSEYAKSYQLQRALLESKAKVFSDISTDLQDKEISLNADIQHYEKKIYNLKQKGVLLIDSAYNNLNTRLFTLKDSLGNFKLHLEQNYPEYYRLKYDLSTVGVEAVQNNLLNSQQTLLEYFVGDSAIYAFVINKENYQVHEIKKDFPLEDWVKIFRKANSKNSYASLTQDYSDIAHQLYQKLVLPFADELKEELIIVPDGVLGYIPFEALLVEPATKVNRFKNHHYWLKDKQISYCYSATLLREMREKKHKTLASKSLLAFAPFYDGDTTLLANLFRYADEIDKQPLSALPQSGEEVYGIQKITGGKVYYQEEATEENFIKEASKYRILHLATHGKADDKVGDYSFLAFTEQKDSIENELLYVRDLYNLQLNADMVVLSACETGIGELQKGEGIISLARGFTYAGAKSIITSLWSVEDESTKDLMLSFYKHLKAGMNKDAALRQAKLDFITNSKSHAVAHPFFWSGFIGIGDMREMKF